MEKKIFKNSHLGEYSLTVLDNGLKVYIMEKPGFSSCYTVFGTKYGSIDTKFSRNGEAEIEVPPGIAHFLEHKLFESEDGDTFSKFAKTGAYANAFTSFDRTCYLFSCSKNFEENLDILLDFVQTPYFTQENVEKEQGIIGQEIRMYEDSPGWRVMFNMLGQMYENHPVKIDIAGTVESIAQIDHNLLYECYNTFYNPSNMFICKAGNIDTEKVLEQIINGMKPRESVTVKRARFQETERLGSNYIEQELEVSKPLFCLGFKQICEEGHPTVKERIVADLTLEILSGDCSELYRRLIDEGLIGDDFSSEYFQGEGYCAFIIEGETEEPQRVADEIMKEIEYIISNGVDENLLSALKKSAYGDAIKRFDSTEGIVMDMIDCAISGGDLFDTADILKTITSKDIISCFKLMKRELSVLSVIKPRKKG